MAKLCPARSPATRRHDPSVRFLSVPVPPIIPSYLSYLSHSSACLSRRPSHEIPGFFLFTSLPGRCSIPRLCAMNAGHADLLAGHAHPSVHLDQRTPPKLSTELHHG
jgi:hypothetical protein